MNILITGVCGFIGFSLAEELMKTKNIFVPIKVGVKRTINWFKKYENLL
ncbi:hypothetical protein N8449_03650 [Alphaproteobacteria bacterium]|nr:hypothetical protein [Alphaproteobacteria bacterium]|tara:strand:+ start:250 stop:396 length:147 start_codon:yes stop_codon:yes gene_type:complete